MCTYFSASKIDLKMSSSGSWQLAFYLDFPFQDSYSSCSHDEMAKYILPRLTISVLNIKVLVLLRCGQDRSDKDRLAQFPQPSPSPDKGRTVVICN
jgi:hypothetical protein